jgi:hypothetical protein
LEVELDSFMFFHAERSPDCQQARVAGDRVGLEAIGPDEQEALSKLELLLLGFRDEERGQS